MDFCVAALLQNLERNFYIGLRDQSMSLLRPFDEKDIAPVELIAEAGRFPFLLVVQAVQVEVAQV